jgi:hypothetical protein
LSISEPKVPGTQTGDSIARRKKMNKDKRMRKRRRAKTDKNMKMMNGMK